MRQCEVYIHEIRAGILTETDSPVGYSFTYDKSYLADPSNPPVCLAMPLSSHTYHSSHLFPFFANMLSEGENRNIQATVHHIDRNDDFGILMATARFDTIGAVTVSPLHKSSGHDC